jgi:Divergent InlB B-repeat domain
VTQSRTAHAAHHNPRAPRRAAALLCAMTILFSLLVGATVRLASAATPSLLLGRPGAGEYQPVEGDAFIAWQQNSRAHPRHYDVYARPLGGGEKFKVNAPSTNGANGEIDGDRLVYQQFKRGASDLKFFDLSSKGHSNPPRRVNTDQWEYWPSLSGRWLLFGRLYESGTRRIILFDLSTNTARRLDKVRRDGAFLAPGQVNGDYAVWHRCQSARKCDVVRYHIPDGASKTIPNPTGQQHAPSVAEDGTVFFARSGGVCGSGVRLVRYSLDGTSAVLWQLPSGDDIGATSVHLEADGTTMVLYDHFACREAAESDAWKIGEELTPRLTVTVEGDAKGTVTSSPAGINCGTDCTETYASVTGVTLTAHPEGSAAFAGWSGACTGSGLTCTLTMDRSRSVTATFTTKPVLTVTKSGSGQGTVTSTPAGIDCGTDCNEPYNEGTSVTLTADPAASSSFEGWSGACTGSAPTCAVTLNVSKEAIATFTLKQYNLHISTTGDGEVTSDPVGIDCGTTGTDCDQMYEHGTSVTLTATPAPLPVPNSVTWGGACDGTQLTCSLTMDGPKSVTATFDPIP